MISMLELIEASNSVTESVIAGTDRDGDRNGVRGWLEARGIDPAQFAQFAEVLAAQHMAVATAKGTDPRIDTAIARGISIGWELHALSMAKSAVPK